jgi:flap endonuclease-1
MGIKQLTQLIGDVAPDSIKENTIKNYFGRKIAIDASMSLYQFLIAVRPDGGVLTNEVGETTSHLQGMFYRTIKMISNGIKPVFVFDGKPPTLKTGELAKRSTKRKEAEEGLEEAKEVGPAEEVVKLTKRTVRVTKQHNEECKRLLQLMGVPIVEAPCEAEAQCAALCRAGKVWATGSEDMDSLTLGTPMLIRRLTFSEARKLPILEIQLDRVLEGLKLTMDQFIDLCILLGCDYCDSIRGIGPKRAMELITKYGCIEKILDNLDKKYVVPENWPYQEVRELFRTPEVADPNTIEFKWSDPDEEGLKKFLVEEKNFNEKRVTEAIEKLKKCKTTSVQGRLDAFFTKVPSPAVKRKREEEPNNGKNKKTKPGEKANAKGKEKGKGKGKDSGKAKGKK